MMRDLSEIQELAKAIFEYDAAREPERLPKQVGFMVLAVSKLVADHNADITQAEFIDAVIGKLETMKAVDRAINRP